LALSIIGRQVENASLGPGLPDLHFERSTDTITEKEKMG